MYSSTRPFPACSALAFILPWLPVPQHSDRQFTLRTLASKELCHAMSLLGFWGGGSTVGKQWQKREKSLYCAHGSTAKERSICAGTAFIRFDRGGVRRGGHNDVLTADWGMLERTGKAGSSIWGLEEERGSQCGGPAVALGPRVMLGKCYYEFHAGRTHHLFNFMSSKISSV